jgi:hypothetical protein
MPFEVATSGSPEKESTGFVCETCQALDFAKLFNAVKPRQYSFIQMGEIWAEEGDLKERPPDYEPILENNPGCVLCQFIRSNLPSELRDRDDVKVQLRSEGADLALGSRLTPDQDIHEVATYVRVCALSQSWYRGFESLRNKAAENPLRYELRSSVYLTIDESGDSTRTKLSRQRVSSAQIDIDRVHNWLRKCDSDHYESCGATTQWSGGDAPKGFNLIDLQTSAIVPSPPHARYAALSYVWGKAKAQMKIPALSQIPAMSMLGHQIPADLPATIADAITFAKELGERYIWIDFLCIDQDNAEETKSQIQNMCYIYEKANFTIVALTNADAAQLLPGIRRGSRACSSKTIEIGTKRILAQGVQSMDTLKSCIWNTRGWTMQEGLFSRRCICFTDEEVFLWCRQSICAETISDSSTPSCVPLLKHKLFAEKDMLPMRSWTGQTWDITTYLELVPAYTSRILTYSFDGLNAFAGAVETLKSMMQTPYYFGIPERWFFLALLWLPNKVEHGLGPKKPKREPPAKGLFPTWSWASCDRLVQYQHLRGKHRFDANRFYLDDYDLNRDNPTYPAPKIVVAPIETGPLKGVFTLDTWIREFHLEYKIENNRVRDAQVKSLQGRHIPDILGPKNLLDCMGGQFESWEVEKEHTETPPRWWLEQELSWMEPERKKAMIELIETHQDRDLNPERLQAGPVTLVFILRGYGSLESMYRGSQKEGFSDVVFAMLVRVVEDIAYRVAVMAFDSDDWDEIEPVQKVVRLG